MTEYNLIMMNESQKLKPSKHSLNVSDPDAYASQKSHRLVQIVAALIYLISLSWTIGYAVYLHKDVQFVHTQLKDLSQLITQCNCPYEIHSSNILSHDSLTADSSETDNQLSDNLSEGDNVILKRSLRAAISENSRGNSKKMQQTNSGNTNIRKQIRREVKKSLKKNRNQEPVRAIGHFIAPQNFQRQFESGAVITFNESISRDVVYRFWTLPEWIDQNAFNKAYQFTEGQGTVTIKQDGLYLVYAQMVYHDLTGRWSFGIYVAEKERVKCLATEQLKDLSSFDQRSHGVYHQCYTAQVMYIRRSETVTIRCMYGMRTILTKPEFTFWGIVKL